MNFYDEAVSRLTASINGLLQQAQLYEKLVKYVEQLSKLKPVTDRRMEILQQYYAFQTSKVTPGLYTLNALCSRPACLQFWPSGCLSFCRKCRSGPAQTSLQVYNGMRRRTMSNL